MKGRLLIVAVLAALVWAAPANAHLIAHPKCDSLACREASQSKNLAHARYVCKHGANASKRWSCKAVRWLTRELNETKAAMAPSPKRSLASSSYWINKQIRVANLIGAASPGDPWPNCPDPFDGRGTWQDTVNCENGGNWYDSPGYYRCGLQFDPGWERKYGQLCP